MTTFHERIKASTEAAHAGAESAEFIAFLMGGQLSKAAYRDYLVALLPIYARMESLFRQRQGEGVLGYFDHRALDRTESIKEDIQTLDRELSDGAKFVELQSVKKYLELLEEDISAPRLLAHHYIRYLGDLSGGLAISKLVARHYQIAPEALAFYNFNEIGDIVFYKKRYRDLLNLLQMSEADENEFLSEVGNLYKLSREIFIELGNYHSPKMAS